MAASRAATLLAQAGAELLDAVYPPRCFLCGSLAEDGLACEGHRLPEKPSGPRCGRCAAALPPAFPDGYRCALCATRAPGFVRLCALADWRAQPAVQPWLFAFKYGGRRDLARPLGHALARRLADEPAWCARSVVVPVPLHVLRRIERGYDQARLLAQAVAERTGARFVEALARTRPTPPQGSPGSVSRESNVRGAFRARALARTPLAGKEVWLMDDVVSSGSTVRECARVLRRAGARRVYVATLARGRGSGQGP
jgi:ComF family protein